MVSLLRFADGAKGGLEASRASVGEQNAYVFEIHGSTGALAWDFRRMGELRVCLDQDYQAAAWATHIIGPADGEAGSFQPDTAIPLSYDDLKVIEAKRLLTSSPPASPRAPPSPTWSHRSAGRRRPALARRAALGRRLNRSLRTARSDHADGQLLIGGRLVPRRRPHRGGPVSRSTVVWSATRRSPTPPTPTGRSRRPSAAPPCGGTPRPTRASTS